MSELALFDNFINDSFPFYNFNSIVPRNMNNNISKHMSVDFIENDKGYEIHADLPGYNKDDINVHIENGVLSLDANKDESKSMSNVDKDGKITDGGNTKYYYKERFTGKVHRSFRLPTNANGDAADVKYLDGVLTLTIPKQENKSAKKLTIN